MRNVTGVHWLTWATGVAVYALVGYLTTFDTGLVAAASYGLFLIIIQTKAESRRKSLSEPRFWCVLAVFAAIHVVVLWYLHVPELKFSLVVAPVFLIDYLLMWLAIEWIERRFPVRA